MMSTTRTLSAPQGVWLVAEREMSTRLRSKAFLISTGILLVAVLVGIIVMNLLASSSSATPIAVTAEASAAVPEGDAFEVTEVADRAAAEALVADGEVDAAVVAADGSPTGILLIGDVSVSSSIVAAFAQQPAVELLQPDAPPSELRFLLGVIFGIVFMMAAPTFGAPITTNVIEEKQTRVIEILLSAIPARVLLAGKVVGNTILAIGQIVLLIAVAVIGLIVTGQNELLQGFGAPLIWFAVFFLFGFVLLAAMFAAAGSLVSRQEDSGATLTPVMYLTMIPYFLVIFFGENPVAMAIMSYVPFSAAVAMPVRLFFDEAAWWEPLAALAVLLASCVLVILLAAKIYENSLLKMGARVRFADALKR